MNALFQSKPHENNSARLELAPKRVISEPVRGDQTDKCGAKNPKSATDVMHTSLQNRKNLVTSSNVSVELYKTKKELNNTKSFLNNEREMLVKLEGEKRTDKSKMTENLIKQVTKRKEIEKERDLLKKQLTEFLSPKEIEKAIRRPKTVDESKTLKTKDKPNDSKPKTAIKWFKPKPQPITAEMRASPYFSSQALNKPKRKEKTSLNTPITSKKSAPIKGKSGKNKESDKTEKMQMKVKNDDEKSNFLSETEDSDFLPETEDADFLLETEDADFLPETEDADLPLGAEANNFLLETEDADFSPEAEANNFQQETDSITEEMDHIFKMGAASTFSGVSLSEEPSHC